MDMVLNAFSMLPGLGTTLLIWRMFQNVMVILGASMNVQAGATKTGAAAKGAVDGAKGSAEGEKGGAIVEGAAVKKEEGGAEGGAEGGTTTPAVAGGTTTPGGAAAGAVAEGGVTKAGETAAIPPVTPVAGGQGGGGAMNQNRHHHSIINGARALHQSLKRFSGLSARMGSFATSNNNSNSKTRTNRKHAPININDINPLASSYALKRLFLFQQPGLKPVAAT
jgi:hypothetical protein